MGSQKHPLIKGWEGGGGGRGGGLLGREQRSCFQSNGLPGYMLSICIVFIYCDNSTTPTDNTAHEYGESRRETERGGGGQTSVGFVLNGKVLAGLIFP